MPQSIVKNYLHITFSTKKRKPILDKQIQSKLYSYISGICSSLESYAYQIGGVEDHIHILCNLSKKITLIKFMEEVKKSSSKWMKTQGENYHDFYWQDGYGAFSVNPSEIEVVKTYILNQEEHHNSITFQEEYRAFLKKYQVDFDERYVWD